jgi:hypothetical protein
MAVSRSIMVVLFILLLLVSGIRCDTKSFPPEREIEQLKSKVSSLGQYRIVRFFLPIMKINSSFLSTFKFVLQSSFVESKCIEQEEEIKGKNERLSLLEKSIEHKNTQVASLESEIERLKVLF